MTSKDISMMKIRCYPCPKATGMHKDLPLGHYLMLAHDDTDVKNICEYLKVHEKGQDDYDKMKISNLNLFPVFVKMERGKTRPYLSGIR